MQNQEKENKMVRFKFRAWDSLYSKMLHSEKLSDFFHAVEQRPEEQRPSVMAWTGLHDKNGKEIYEGDILQGQTGGLEVVWEQDCAGFRTRYAHGAQYFLTDKLPIIGNVYENSDLIGK